MDTELDFGDTQRVKRPCCVRVFEALHVVALPVGLLLSPRGMMPDALPWLLALLLAALAVSRLRLALVWLALTAVAIGFLIFMSFGIAAQTHRLVDNPVAWARIVYVFGVSAGSLLLLWRRETMVWLRAKGGKLSRAVF